MHTNEEILKISMAELDDMAARIQAKYSAGHPDRAAIYPLDLVIAMSKQVLASYFPEHSQSLLAETRSATVEHFVLNLLSVNEIPPSLWLLPEQQEELFGGREVELFQKPIGSIITNCGRRLNRIR
jgi:hypothetical protein